MKLFLLALVAGAYAQKCYQPQTTCAVSAARKSSASRNVKCVGLNTSTKKYSPITDASACQQAAGLSKFSSKYKWRNKNPSGHCTTENNTKAGKDYINMIGAGAKGGTSVFRICMPCGCDATDCEIPTPCPPSVNPVPSPVTNPVANPVPAPTPAPGPVCPPGLPKKLCGQTPGCMFSKKMKQCEVIDCSKLKGKKCNRAGCTWSKKRKICFSGQAPVEKCSDQTTKKDCKKTKNTMGVQCHYDGHGTCMDSKPAPVCSDAGGKAKKCGGITSPVTGLACYFDKATKTCLDQAPPPACANQKNKSKCNDVSTCVWDGQGSCIDKPACDAITDKKMCKGAGCTYNKGVCA